MIINKQYLFQWHKFLDFPPQIIKTKCIIIYYFSIENSMKHHLIPVFSSLVPEWKLCYYNYNTLYDLVDVFQKLATIHQSIRPYVVTYQRVESSIGQRSMQTQRDLINLIKQMNRCDQQITIFRFVQLKVIYLFTNYKIMELKIKFKFYKYITDPINRDDSDVLTLIQSIYIQIGYLKCLIQNAMGMDQRIVRIMASCVDKFQQFHRHQQDRNIARMLKVVNILSQQVMKYFISKKGQDQVILQNERKRLKRLVNFEQNFKNTTTYPFGFFFGVAVLFLTFTISYIGYYQIVNQKVFMDYFPIWRGLAPFIFYLYMVGFATFIFQHKQINYKKIMHFGQYDIPDSRSIVGLANAITILYCIFFFFYGRECLNNPQETNNLPALITLSIFIIFIYGMFFPINYNNISKNFPGRIFMQALLFKMLGTATLLRQVDYGSNWLSQQLTSFKLAFQDLSYVILILLYGNRKQNEDIAFLIGAIIGSLMFSIRILQAINKIKKLKTYRPMIFGILKCTLGIATIWTSYASRVVQKQNQNQDYTEQGVFVAWIVVAGISTLYAYGFDIRYDWDILSIVKKENQNKEKDVNQNKEKDENQNKEKGENQNKDESSNKQNIKDSLVKYIEDQDIQWDKNQNTQNDKNVKQQANQIKNKNKCCYCLRVRQFKIYSKYTYRLFIIINFFLRVAWTLTISTDLAKNFFAGADYILVTVFSILQIFRRGLWNLIFIEKDHVKNIQQYNAVIHYKQIQEKMIQRCMKLNGQQIKQQIEKLKPDSEQNKDLCGLQKDNIKKAVQISKQNQRHALIYIRQAHQRVLQFQQTHRLATRAERG